MNLYFQFIRRLVVGFLMYFILAGPIIYLNSYTFFDGGVQDNSQLTYRDYFLSTTIGTFGLDQDLCNTV
jgi:hypothetical protein